jgi:hypothetical protein
MLDQLVVQKWEYFVEEFAEPNTMADGLTRRGSEGWELVSMVGGNSVDAGSGHAKTLRRRNEPYRAVFKRPIV